MVIIIAPLTVRFGLGRLVCASGELWIAIIDYGLQRFFVMNCSSVTVGDFPPIPGYGYMYRHHVIMRYVCPVCVVLINVSFVYIFGRFLYCTCT